MLSLFTEFITEFESTWAITVHLNNYLLKVKGRSVNNVHFILSKYFLILVFIIMLFYLIRAMEYAKYTFVIYAIEQDRNRDRRDACELWFFLNF